MNEWVRRSLIVLSPIIYIVLGKVIADFTTLLFADIGLASAYFLGFSSVSVMIILLIMSENP